MFNIQTKAKAFSAFGMKCLLCRRIQATETPLDKCVLNTRHNIFIIVEHSFGWKYKYLSLSLIVLLPHNIRFPIYNDKILPNKTFPIPNKEFFV